MKYAHILNYAASTVWAILPAKMAQIVAVLSKRATGQEISAEDIAAAISERLPTGPTSQGMTAVVPLMGTIAHRMGGMDESSGGTSAEAFTRAIRQLRADDSIRNVLINCASCGGAVTGVQQAAQAVYDLRATKHVIAIANGPMASACFWIASQAHERVAIPDVFDGHIGSIGAYLVHEDISEALSKEGHKITLIAAGKHKLDANPFVPLTDEQHAELLASVNVVYDRFVKDVARGLGVAPSEVRNGYGEGRGLSSVDAKAAGLIDRIDTFDATLARLAGRRSSVAVGARAEADESMRLHAGEEPREKPAIPVTSEVVEDLEVATGLAESLLASRMEPDAVESAAGAVAEPEPAAPDPWPALDLRRRALELGV